MKQNLGGLLFTLRPNEQIEIRNSDYVLCNRSLVTVRIHLYLKIRANAVERSAKIQKGKSDVTNN